MKVRFTRPAQADLQQIHAFVSENDPQEASRLVARLIERAQALGYVNLKAYGEFDATHRRTAGTCRRDLAGTGAPGR